MLRKPSSKLLTTHSLLLVALLPTHRRLHIALRTGDRTVPRAVHSLLAHGEACDTEVVRDITDNDVAESRVRREGEEERCVDEDGYVGVGVLDEGWAVRRGLGVSQCIA